MIIIVMKKIILILCLCVAACAGIRPIDSPVEIAAGRYIGAPYVLDSLGEGPGAPYDSDPIHRTDAFDCLTFVETVLADARGIDLQKIRYSGGRVDWFERNHWTESQWIPNAEKLNLIRPVEFDESVHSHASVNLGEWYSEKIPPLAKVSGGEPVSVNARDRKIIESAVPFEMSVPYVPRADTTSELLSRLPRDVVVFFIKCGASTPVIRGDYIAHTGFLFGGRNLVHAGQDAGVVRVDFRGYLNTGKFCGVAFYKVIDDNE